jgi:hypothetical protein
MARFVKATMDVADLVQKVRDRSYPELAALNLASILAQSARLSGPAFVRPTSPAFRAAGLADVVLIFDEHVWEEANRAEREGIVDHGLASIEVLTRGDRPSIDSAGRVRVRRRPFDIPGIGWHAPWRRHRKASVEYRAAAAMRAATAAFFGDAGKARSRKPANRPMTNPPMTAA